MEQSKPSDGEWFRISYEVTEALYRFEALNKNHIRLALYIIRMTWGWNRKFFIFRQADAVKATGINPSNLSKAFHQLREADVIATQKGEVGINKIVSEWVPEALVGKTPISWQNANKKLAKRQEVVGKLPTKTRRRAANDAGCDDPKDNKDNKDNNPLTPCGGSAGPPRPKQSKPEPHRFAEFWAIYPKKKTKDKAIDAWNKIRPDDALVDQILKAVALARQTRDWTKDKGQYVPHPTTWLNGRRWEDELEDDIDTANPFDLRRFGYGETPS